MAAGAFVFSQKTKLDMLEGATGLLKNGSALYYIALVKSTWVPAPTTDELWGDVSANEIAVAGQTAYVAGGAALTAVTLAQAAGVVKFTSAAQMWTANGTGIPPWRYMVVYYLGTLNGKINPLVAYALGDATPADVPLTSAPNTLTITPSASGIMSAT